MLTSEQIHRLLLLIFAADCALDRELQVTLERMLCLAVSRELLNRTDEHGRGVAIDGKRRAI